MEANNLAAFKAKIERILHPWQWNPALDQLARLAADFAQKAPKTQIQALIIFQRHFPGHKFLAVGGADNSDYNTLLTLALADAKAASR
ncbi:MULTISPECIES: hypothetical protein [unclassified Pseudomonas]|uniref:hypothetical protein n=1 Tax=unclassified Pseudomonas TaxID=196821 RepID=UPI0008D2CD5C|nr:hypothetical protein [Pseudomonas sp. NFR16]SEJ67841.1 hypothetical protein SAMN03159495_4122 [Pseudomonas sp. NFR16]